MRFNLLYNRDKTIQKRNIHNQSLFIVLVMVIIMVMVIVIIMVMVMVMVMVIMIVTVMVTVMVRVGPWLMLGLRNSSRAF